MVLCGDNAAETMDEILDSAGTGHVQKLDTALSRAFSSGTHSSAILTRSLMHFSNLREMRAAYDQGKTLQEILSGGRFRVHFSRKAQWKARSDLGQAIILPPHAHVYKQPCLKPAKMRIWILSTQGKPCWQSQQLPHVTKSV